MSDQNRFLHFSDAHIGHRQYGVKQRRDDMFQTFNTTILDAIDAGVDFAVFSGDLFHNKNVNARALRDAEEGLAKFDNAGIPVVAIQGNHDANLYKEDLNWLEYLHSQERLILLEANIQGDGPLFEAHDFNDPGKSSGYVDIGDVRIFGLQYLGQRTNDYIDEIAEGISQVNSNKQRPQLTILLGHFGIEGHVPGMGGGISFNSLTPLEDVVDYLGLGHLHKQYEHGDWVFNPGSLEAHDTREAQWKHGYYLVDIENDGFTPTFHNSKRRPYFTIEVTVDEFETPEIFKSTFEQKIDNQLPKLREIQQQRKFKAGNQVRDPVIDLRLSGLLQFSRSQLDIDSIRDLTAEKTNALYVNLTDATESKETANIIQELDNEEDIRDGDGDINQEKLETAVFRELARQDSRYNDKEEAVADTLKTIKQQITAEETPESIAETIKSRRRDLFANQEGESE